MKANRREFLAASAALAIGPAAKASAAPPAGPIRVVVWDERQPRQGEAYDDFLGNRIAEHLRSVEGLSVASVGIDDPGQGLAAGVLDDAKVLVWWGHVRNGEIAPEVGREIVGRIKAGTLSLVALHSAHWSTPFVEAMNERARIDALKEYSAGGEPVELAEVAPPGRYTTPEADDRVTPFATARKFPGGPTKVTLRLPICCFPAYGREAEPGHLRVVRPGHPIASGIPAGFTLPKTEMYDEPFHVPAPDEVVFEERWAKGEWFRSGMVWEIGRGKVFYFRPGHETYPIYRRPIPLAIVANAVKWLGSAST